MYFYAHAHIHTHAHTHTHTNMHKQTYPGVSASADRGTIYSVPECAEVRVVLPNRKMAMRLVGIWIDNTTCVIVCVCVCVCVFVCAYIYDNILDLLCITYDMI